MSPSPKTLFLQYGKRTSMHGWSHIYQSNDVRRRGFWFVLALLGTVATTLHIAKTLNTYLDTPVNSRKLMGTIDSIFPDVTVCNSEMIPTIFLEHEQGKAYLKHLRNKYDMFRKVLIHRFHPNSMQPKKALNPQKEIDMLRMDDWQTVNNVFASEDTSEISIPFSTFIVHCKFMRSKENCHRDNWTLVQDSRYGNCYTFRPTISMRSPLSNDPSYGLVLYLYIGDYSIKTFIKDDQEIRQTKSVKFIESTDRFSKPHTDYPDFVRILNYLHPPNGIRVLIHERDTFPDVRRNGLDIGSGQIADIKFMMEHVQLVNHFSRPCNTKPEDERKIKILRGFKNNHTEITPLWDNYRNSTTLCVSQHLQSMMYEGCNCYTHLYPTTKSPEKYCFYVPGNMTNSSAVMQRIRCHNKKAGALVKLVPKINKDCMKERPCEHNYYHLSTLINPWPSLNNIQDLMSFIIIPSLKNEEFNAHIVHLDNEKVEPLRPLEHIIVGNSTHWRTAEEVLRKNFIKVRVFPDAVTGDEHREVPSYHFAEALSEIGGIFGLWVGMSLLTFFEFFELIVLMVIASVRTLMKQSKSHRSQHQNRRTIAWNGGNYLATHSNCDTTSADNDVLSPLRFPTHESPCISYASVLLPLRIAKSTTSTTADSEIISNVYCKSRGCKL